MNAKLYVQETWINETKHYQIGETDIYEPFTDNVKTLFKSLQREYGRCTSKVYIDVYQESRPREIGWVFEKRVKYEDCNEFYLQCTWVTLYKDNKIVTSIKKPDYFELS